jgi:hypothetical protein
MMTLATVLVPSVAKPMSNQAHRSALQYDPSTAFVAMKMPLGLQKSNNTDEWRVTHRESKSQISKTALAGSLARVTPTKI